MNREEALGLIERHFSAQDLNQEEHTELRNYLKTDAEARKAYDEAAQADLLLAGTDVSPALLQGMLARGRPEARPAEKLDWAHQPVAAPPICEPAPAAQTSNVVSLDARRKTRWGALSIAAGLMAAGMAFALIKPAPQILSPLPDYSLSVRGDQLTRGAHDTQAEKAIKLSPSSLLKLQFDLDESLSGPIAVRVFVEREGQLKAIEGDFDQPSAGAFPLKINRNAIPAQAGDFRLITVVARPQALPKAEVIKQNLSSQQMRDKDGQWILFTHALNISNSTQE